MMANQVTTKQPSSAQFIASSIALLLLSAFLAPFSLVFVAAARLLAHLSYPQRSPIPGPVVLINGAKMYKSLGLVRVLGRAGCKIILADQGSEGSFSATRFSRFVSRYAGLPLVTQGQPETSQRYIDALVLLAVQEGVDIFLPCSGAGSTVEDAQAAEILRKGNKKIRCFITSSELTRELHEKDRFMALLAELNCPRPETITVSTPGEAIEVLKNSKHKIIMKATAVLDDVGRNDMTQYPIDGESAPYSKTRERLKIGLSVPLSPKTPYIMQQFVQGTEWCTHATVVDNKLKAFACCPSSDMLMHYEDGTRTIAGKLAEKWTLKFLDAWAHSHRGQKEPFTGHFSMDFICTPDHMLYPIECNPRVHTAICLLVSNKFFASAYIDASSLSAPVIPTDVSLTKAWIGHDLPALILPRYIPALNWLHSFIGHVNLDPISSWPTPMQILVSDPTFTLYDPLPFYALYHIQWPALLALQLVKKRTKWSRVNLSTSRIFEC